MSCSTIGSATANDGCNLLAARPIASLYQRKHYDSKLDTSAAAAEIGKVLYYTSIGDYSIPREYWFVTHLGATSPLQDLLDDPEKLRKFTLRQWDKYCSKKIT